LASDFRAIRISDHVYWVGAIDWDLRDFHGYATERGTTYNAFLILGDDPILVDTVKAPFKDEMLARIASVVDPQRIRYVISNHAELDHSACLPDVIALAKPERVYASAMGAKALAEHALVTSGITAVKDGETLELSGLTLQFVETRMLHWPDSMFTYLQNDRVLFTQDAFGMHLASHERFTDEVPRDAREWEAAAYFANILLPYSSRVSKLLTKLGGTDLPQALLAPDHGPLWRQGQDWILNAYGHWAAQAPARKAVIIYDTMWQSTESMARAIQEGIVEAGGECALLHLRTAHRSDVATELLEAGALIVGTPTLNDQMFPTVADVLVYLKGLKPQHKIGAVFGSHGWTGSGVDDVKKMLSEMAIELVADSLKIKFVPDGAALDSCRALGRQLAATLAERAGITV
jgi:flavorubredoxin